MVDLTRLPHLLDAAQFICRAVIETPKGRRSKYDYSPELGGFELAGLLPEGMSFPLDFGFIPSTKAEDGDPLDVLVLADEPSAVGAIVQVRLLGVIEAEQTEDGDTVRNDRLIAVSRVSRLHLRAESPEDLGEEYLGQLQEFWTHYNALKGKQFKVLSVRGRSAAVAAIRRASGERA